MKNLKFIFPLLFFIVASCKERPTYGDVLVKPEAILKNQTTFLNYWFTAMDLSHDFIGLDSFSKEIPKNQFLKFVASGHYLPIRLVSDSSSLRYYKLYKIKAPVDNYIINMLKAIGAVEYKNFEWEGQQLPDINYTDLEGKKYDSETIKGKILVLDFWFIGCTYCVREIPELNKLKAKYENKKDVLFAAIAFDKEKVLRKFIKKIDFHFDIISDTASFLLKKLGINTFPTTVVINKQGRIAKILDDQYHLMEDLKETLKKECLD